MDGLKKINTTILKATSGTVLCVGHLGGAAAIVDGVRRLIRWDKPSEIEMGIIEVGTGVAVMFVSSLFSQAFFEKFNRKK